MLPLNQRGSPSGLYPQISQQLFDLTLVEEDPAAAGDGGEFAAVEGPRTDVVSAGVGSGCGFSV